LAKPARPDVYPALPPPPSLPTAEPQVARTLSPVASTIGESATAARKSTSDGSRSLIRALGLKVNRVVIDAGHGGHDVGTTGPTGLLEKDLVLDVALRLGKLIEQRMGSEVIFTRQDDTYIGLEERTAIANRNHADLFLSIHANSSPIKAVAGVETFYLNFTSSADALDVASRENASSQKSVFELRDLIQSISLHDKIEESKEFASDLQRTMQANAVRYISTARDRGIKKAPFVVLIGAQMPSVLSEIGFISNPREEALLKRADHRQQIAEALYKGLSRYSDSLSHVQVASQGPVVAKSEREVAAK
jgi:N-acetylmuramoyl-L-alanine amidase